MKNILLTLFVLPVFIALAQPTDLHNEWDKLLRRHVTPNGKVGYDGFKKDISFLDAYLTKMSQNEPQAGWSDNAVKAYWMNLYNAATIKLVLTKYPIESITKVMDKPWDYKFIKVGKNTYTLNEIEHNILRKKYKDARIHFGVNCAAVSCPKLHYIAFTEENVDTELTKLARLFINNKNKNKVTANSVQISKIFEWYREDFGKTDAEVIAYINKYADVKASPKTKIQYLEYDWALNK
jgi:hypothetical protein